MKSPTLRLVFNVLAVCGSAGFAGTMLSIGLSFGGLWESLTPAAFLDWFAANHRFVARPIPYLTIVTMAGIGGSTYFSWGSKSERVLWLGSISCVLALAALTFAYFVPTNTLFASGTLDDAAVQPRLREWLDIHWMRISFGFAAAALASVAISRERRQTR